MSRISGVIGGHFAQPPRGCLAYSGGMNPLHCVFPAGSGCAGWATWALACLLMTGAVRAGETPLLDSALEQQVRQLALSGTRAAPTDGPARPAAAAPRVEVQVGTLDARLRLAPCDRVEPYLPAGARLWGKTRIGLRCAQGRTPWNVFLPVTIKVFGPALVASAALPAGTVLAASDLGTAEIDLAEDGSPALTDTRPAVGRSLARAIEAGQGLRQSHLKPRQWFTAGDTVQVRAVGSGFAVAGAGQALTHGIEGQTARVRTESGRVVSGDPVAERRIDVPL